MAESDKTPPASSRKGQTLARMIRASKQAKSRFQEVGQEIEKYWHSQNHDFDYQSWDTELSFKAKVCKTTQFIQVVGAFLHKNNPDFRTMVRDWAPPLASERARVMEDYLRYCTGENGLFHELRAAINDGLSWGCGVVWHGIHPDKPGVVTAVHDSVENLLIDPDATCLRDANWVARKRRKPRWWLTNKYPDKKFTVGSLPASSKSTDEGGQADKDSGDQGVELVEYYEIYLRVGLHNYRGGIDLSAAEDLGNGKARLDDGPRKYVVTPDGVVLWSGNWEIPFFLDGDWPCTILSFFEHPKSPWPISPLEPGLPWQRAINWAATKIVAKQQFSGREIYALLHAMGIDFDQDDLEAILSSREPVKVFPVEAKLIDGSMPDVGKLLQRLDTSADLSQDLEVLQYLNRQFEEHTSLYEILLGGGSQRQMRSAQEASMKERMSTNRIDDMSARLDEWFARLARKMAITAWYWVNQEDIGKLMGPEAAQVWGVLMSEEEMDPEYQLMRLMQEQPPNSPEEMMMLQQQAMQTAESGYSLEQIMREVSFTVEAGTSRRRTPEQEADMAENWTNTLIPALLQVGALRTASVFMAKAGKVSGMDRDEIAILQQFPDEVAAMQAAMQPAPPPGAPPA